MKIRHLSFLTLVLACPIIGCQTEETKEKWTIVNVQQLNPGESADYNFETAEARQVDIFNAGSPEVGMYQVRYYHEYNDSLEGHSASLAFSTQYDLGRYRWMNDTTVRIELIDSKTDSSFAFTVFGNGKTNGMSIDE
jgi:hypothetical protein